MPEETNEQENVRRGDFAREKGEVVLREHEYDGIQEFDQKLPNWWLFTFYIAIIWFVLYWVLYYHTGTFETDQARIVRQVRALNAEKARIEAEALASTSSDDLINVWAKDPEKVAAGQKTYMALCVGCHGEDLTARIGDVPLPGLPLHDSEWKYGSRPVEDIFKIINEGTPPDDPGHNGARMIPWGQQLNPQQIFEVVSFIISKNPDGVTAE